MYKVNEGYKPEDTEGTFFDQYKLKDLLGSVSAKNLLAVSSGQASAKKS